MANKQEAWSICVLLLLLLMNKFRMFPHTGNIEV